MKPLRLGIAVASLIFGFPSALLTVYALSLFYWLHVSSEPRAKLIEDFMTLGLYATYLAPAAVLSVVLAACATGYRKVCIAVAMVYFIGWGLMVGIEQIQASDLSRPATSQIDQGETAPPER